MSISVTDLDLRTATGQRFLYCPTFDMRSGQIFGVVGESGSGKTTLLRAIAGALPHSNCQISGSVSACGSYPLTMEGEQLRGYRRTTIALVGQDPGSRLNPRLRVHRLLAEVGADANARREILRAVGLTDRSIPHRRVNRLSGGQQRRVALARALVRPCPILLLDEPTAGLDGDVRHVLAQLLRARAAHGTTVLIACHDRDWIDSVADEIVELGTATRSSALLPSVISPVIAPVVSSSVRDSVRTETCARTNSDNLQIERLSAWADPRRRSTLLDSISFSIGAGKAVGVVGDSGAGKTSLARALIGLQPHTEGRISLDGTPLPAHVRRRSRAQTMAIQLVPQDPLGTLNPARTVAATLRRPLQSIGHRRPMERIAELLSIVGLDARFADRYPHELSGGQRQRIALARALAVEPKVLICDEVTSALDPGNSAAIMRLLGELRAEQGVGVLLISHELALVAQHTEDVVVLGDGRMLASGPSSAVLRHSSTPPY